MTRPFFLGTEASKSPSVKEMLRVAADLAREGGAGGTLSARHGLRCTVSAAGVPFEALGEEQFVEVADYDPHTDHLLCIGSTPPSPFAGLHALVYRAKAEVGAIVQIDVPPDHPVLASVPAVPRGRTMLEGAVSILEALRKATVVGYSGKALIATGRTPAEAYEGASAAIRASKDGAAAPGAASEASEAIPGPAGAGTWK